MRPPWGITGRAAPRWDSPVDAVPRLRGRQPGQRPGLHVHRVSADFRRVPGNDVAEGLIVSGPEFVVDVEPAGPAAWRGAGTGLGSGRVGGGCVWGWRLLTSDVVVGAH